MPDTRIDSAPTPGAAPEHREPDLQDGGSSEPGPRLRAHRPGRPFQRLLFSPGARRAWTLALTLLVGLTLAQALSPVSEPAVTVGWDKADHLAAFSALAGVGVIALHDKARGRWWLVAGLLGLGALIEIVQFYVPGRSSEWEDLAADALGIALGLLVGATVTARFERRKQRRDGAVRRSRRRARAVIARRTTRRRAR